MAIEPMEMEEYAKRWQTWPQLWGSPALLILV
jgi:hypothetical protein